MINSLLESVLLLDIDRLECKNCHACSTEPITENNSASHSCYLHNKETVNRYRYANMAIFNLKFMDLITEEEFVELKNWLKSNYLVDEDLLFSHDDLCECCGWF